MRIQLPIIILVLSTISCAEPFSDIDQDLSEDRSSYFHEKEVGFPSTAPQRNARVYHPPVEDAVPNYTYCKSITTQTPFLSSSSS